MGINTCSLLPFPDTFTAVGLQQFLGSELSRVSSWELQLLSKSACSKPSTSSSSAISTAGTPSRHHADTARGGNFILCSTGTPSFQLAVPMPRD